MEGISMKNVVVWLVLMGFLGGTLRAGNVIEGPVTLDAQKLEAFKKSSKGKLGLVYVHAWWCGQCMLYQGKIKRFAKQHLDKVSLLIVHYGNSKAFLLKQFGIDDMGYVVRYENGAWSKPEQYPALALSAPGKMQPKK